MPFPSAIFAFFGLVFAEKGMKDAAFIKWADLAEPINKRLSPLLYFPQFVWASLFAEERGSTMVLL